MESISEPPHSNRGVVIDSKNDLTALLDYIRVSFKTHDIDLIVESILHLKKEYMLEKEYGMYGYIGTLELDNIKVFYSAPDDNRGILVEMSGLGCRQFESFLKVRRKTWLDFFSDCENLNGKYTRFDLAIDDYKTRLSIPTLLNKAQKGECISRFDVSDFNGGIDLNTGEHRGTTMYIGSKKSELYMCFYQKNYEQAKKLKINVDEIGSWNRYELRMKNDRAQEFVKNLIRQKNMNTIGLQVIHNYVRFTDSVKGVKKENWKTNKKWQRFIGDIQKLSLYTKPSQEFFEKSKRWLVHSAAPTMKMVLEGDKVLGTSDLSDMVLNAQMSKKQEKMLEVMLLDVSDLVIKESEGY
ncbi:replication initiation factor domain-containing protein [Listeria welshimeri]|uniref:Replication initiation factor domain-containing protein n=1 Tax=Listeria farberi TaxID=2713500 RepID=A0ABR6SIX6_9LIST|nr:MULTISPECIES: replication initiation factor domain-containing protein [Listeria]EEO1968936.1 replication initiation factor domain-containing protein [Listeria monocytogenes]EEO6643571.1 replication initiation factor domain-containing protein [Listeria monocytogenes]EEO9130633.1 replication initiation factor domain-containing protein [Listeria monocytogenes]MBC1374191.1 replication initiation factor domain-containing protein [Listeria farberi]MBC1381156.1 replication initiation factor domain